MATIMIDTAHAPAPPIADVAAILLRRYGPWPDESSGPVLDQLVWFLLSTRTTVENCEAAYAALRSRYPTWDDLATAREEDLYAPLRPAGLFRARAKNLLSALTAIQARFGFASLEALRSWSDGGCETFLLSLPGAGLKVARCVMSFGLRRRVFAVDAHIWRVTRRLGWHAFPGEAPSRRGADFLQSLVTEAPTVTESAVNTSTGIAAEVPAGTGTDILSFHVNLIRFGREFCPSGEPRCVACPLAGLCANCLDGAE